MSGLVVRFAMRMRKRAANTQGETSSGLEVLDEKRSKRSGLDEEVQANQTMITMDSPERVLEALFVVGVASQPKDETLIEELPHVAKASIEAYLTEATGVLSPLARWASLTVLGGLRPLDRLVLSSYVEPMEWAKPKEDAPALDQEAARALINY